METKPTLAPVPYRPLPVSRWERVMDTASPVLAVLLLAATIALAIATF